MDHPLWSFFNIQDVSCKYHYLLNLPNYLGIVRSPESFNLSSPTVFGLLKFLSSKHYFLMNFHDQRLIIYYKLLPLQVQMTLYYTYNWLPGCRPGQLDTVPLSPSHKRNERRDATDGKGRSILPAKANSVGMLLEIWNGSSGLGRFADLDIDYYITIGRILLNLLISMAYACLI